jgi:hypothetical protein
MSEEMPVANKPCFTGVTVSNDPQTPALGAVKTTLTMVRNRGGCAHVVRERTKHASREDYLLDRMDCGRSRFRLADLVFSPEKIISEKPVSQDLALAVPPALLHYFPY